MASVRECISQPSCRRKSRPCSSKMMGIGLGLSTRNITCRLLRSLTNDPFGSITFLDLSFSGIHRINGLASCPNIQVVILHGNCIDLLPNFRCCQQIWKIDLSCNRIKNLSGFEYFKTLGTLILCENEVEWLELLKIRHLQILSLNLLGNQKLVKDPNYRKHVIVNFPLLWFLDGELVTTEERSSINRFFQSSIKTKNPVWMKLPTRQHIPTFMKISSNIVFGKRAFSVSKNFGLNETHNRALDKKRLLYLSRDMNEDIYLELSSPSVQKLISNVLEFRQTSKDESNMFLLMLICSLIFSVPTTLMKQILQTSQLTKLGAIPYEDIFDLPLQVKVSIVSLLVSCLKIDGEDGIDNGISPLLHQKLTCLNVLLTKVAYGSSDVLVENNLHNIIAVEFMKVFCLVPNFKQYLEEESVMEIVVSATKNKNIRYKISDIFNEGASFCVEKSFIEMITSEIETSKYAEHVHSLKIICKKSRHGPLQDQWYGGEVERQSKPRPATAPPFISKPFLNYSEKIQGERKYHTVGDKVLLSQQRIGHIISIPDVNVILVQIDTLPPYKYQQADFLRTTNLSEHSLCYVDANSLVWDHSSYNWVAKDYLSETQLSAMQASAVQAQHVKRSNTEYCLHKPPMQFSRQQLCRKEKLNSKVYPKTYALDDDSVRRRAKELTRVKDEISIRTMTEKMKLSNNSYPKHWINYDISLHDQSQCADKPLQPSELKCLSLQPFQ